MTDADGPKTPEGVGARLPRKEDERLMRGLGQYVGDIRLPGMQDVAFVRSPLAHARIRGVDIPDAVRDRVFTAADLDNVKAIRAVSGLPGFKLSEQPPLATGKVRHVGELIAMCVAPTRAEAEDIAASVALDLEELPAVSDMRAALQPGSALVHEHWGDNVFLETALDTGIAPAIDAPIKVKRTISTGRQCMAPIEGRGCVAMFDHRADQLVLITASQMQHVIRTGLSECLGLEEGRVRIVSPDVGGGFGYKAILLAEEICLGWLALRRRHSVRWLEDRREHLTANANCREHHYEITIYAERDGRLRGVDCEAIVLARVAAGIAYRAVRNRGTIGGSLAHADPAADWVSALSALGTEVEIASRTRERRLVPLGEFVRGALDVALAADELVTAVRVPVLTPSARWGYVKHCRKVGEFAEAIGAVVIDPEARRGRAVIGAVEAAPIVIEDARVLFGGAIGPLFAGRFDGTAADALLAAAGMSDPVDRHIHVTVLRRAIAQACGQGPAKLQDAA